VVIPTGTRAPEDAEVQLIASPRAIRVPIGSAVAGTLAGVALVSGGLFLGWLAFTTPIISALSPNVLRPTLPQMAMGGLVWGVALVAPPSFAIVGLWRLSRVVRALTVKPATPILTTAAADLGDDFLAASDVRLPDGRVIRNLIVGPFGVAVLNELPPSRFVRRTGESWEARGPGGRWFHIENPLERAARDGERVKRWFAAGERDYVLKVYAALVTADPTLGRSPACAVVRPDQVSAWLASLPPARSITPDRRQEIVEHVRTLL
jgi:hypothetical protein